METWGKNEKLTLYFFFSLFSLTLAGKAILNPALPIIENELQINHTLTLFILSTSNILSVALIVSAPLVINKIGTKKTMIVAIVFPVMSFFLVFLSKSYIQLLMSMIFIGVGQLYAPTSVSYILNTFSESNGKRIIGILQTCPSFTYVISFLISGFIAQTSSWRISYLILGIIGSIVTFLFIRGFIEINTYVDIEKRKVYSNSKHIIKSLLQNKLYVLFILMYGLMNAISIGSVSLVVLFLTNNLTVSVGFSGLILGISRTGGIIGPIISTKIKKNYTLIMFVCTAFITILILSLYFTNMWLFVLICLFFTFLLSTVFYPISQLYVSTIVPSTNITMAVSGFYLSMMIIAGIVSPIVSGIIADTFNIKSTFIYLSSLGLISTFISLYLYKEKKK
ncbi:MAG: sugar MFS transporter [Candidatus Hodarchaeota archaeon]